MSNDHNKLKELGSSWNVSRGIRDGIPISLGYLAVSFSLGIAAGNAGMTAIQGFILSATNLASSGEYAGILLYSENAGYLSLALMILIANARYLLMSCAVTQKFSPETKLPQRLLVGFGLTDELFGLAIATPGYIRPKYMYAALVTAALGWSVGTSLGVIVGDIVPPVISEAMNVAIFGMFLAIIIPPSKTDRHALYAVIASFVISFIASIAPGISALSSGTRTLILTIIIASAVALIFPVADDADDAGSKEVN